MFDGEVQKYRILLSEDKRLCAEGVEKILAVSDDAVSLKLRGRVLDIEGKGIVLTRIERGRVVLDGRFFCVRLSGGREEKTGKEGRP